MRHGLSDVDGLRDRPDGADAAEAAGGVRRRRRRRHGAAFRDPALLRRPSRRILRHQEQVGPTHARKNGRGD